MGEEVEETLKAIDALAARATAAPWKADEGDGTQRYDKESSAKIMLWADEDCADHPVADFSANHTCREDATCEANEERTATGTDPGTAPMRLIQASGPLSPFHQS